ncbi:hypothetical protein [Lacibacter sp. H407]|uniref:hypothetical protein n=1 Tax=Lacibacter sp. H407 TaxID=3133423 RepID=UPI0030C35F9A
MKKLAVPIICVLLLGSCSEQTSPHTFTNDYEQSFGWQNVPVIKGNAHSGSYAEAITPDREFSATFLASFSQIEPAELLPSVMANVWVYGSKLSQPVSLVLHVTDPTDGRTIAYKSSDLNPQDANGKWFNLILAHTLPADIRGNYVCKVYLWNANKQNVLADDFQIVFEK